MSIARRVSKNILFLLLSEAIFQLLSLALILYLARILGPTSFGNVNFALAIIGYFLLFTNLGLPLLGIREVARDKTRLKEYLVSIITARLTLLLPSLLLIVIIFSILEFTTEANYLILMYGIGLIPSVFLIDWLFQGLEKMEYVAVGRIINIIIYSGLVFALIQGTDNILYIPAFQVVGTTTAVAVLLLIFIRKFGNTQFVMDTGKIKKMLSLALPMGICQIMIQVLYNIDTIMLGMYVSSEEIGFYNASYKIILAIILAGAVYFDAVFPLISQYYQSSLDLMQKVQTFSARLVAVFAMPMTIGGIILAKPIILLLYGEEYASGANALKILLCVASFVMINSIFGRGLWASDRQKIFLRIVSGQAGVNILLNLLFIPWAGIDGAALSTLLAELFGIYFYYSEFSKVVKVPLWAQFIKPACAAAIMGCLMLAGLEIAHLSPIILLPVGCLSYFAILYLLKGITRIDIMTIKSIFFGSEERGKNRENSDRLS